MHVDVQHDVAVVGMHEDVHEKYFLNFGVQVVTEVGHVLVIDVTMYKVQEAEVTQQK